VWIPLLAGRRAAATEVRELASGESRTQRTAFRTANADCRRLLKRTPQKAV
jgi:hypothetical protein